MLDLSLPDHAALPHAACPACRAEVLVYTDLDEDDKLVVRCLDCDAPLGEPGLQTCWTPDQAVEAGYPVEGWLPPDAGAGCSSGGCSGGSCSKH